MPRKPPLMSPDAIDGGGWLRKPDLDWADMALCPITPQMIASNREADIKAGRKPGTTEINTDKIDGTMATKEFDLPLRVKYAEDEPRDDHGRWTAGGGEPHADAERPELIKPHFEKLVNDLKTKGGFSYNPRDGSEPKDGYMVAYQHSERTLPVSSVTAADLEAYWNDYTDRLAEPGSHFGGWNNEKGDGLVYLDVSRQFHDFNGMAQFGRENEQKAYYDVVKEETFPIPGV